MAIGILCKGTNNTIPLLIGSKKVLNLVCDKILHMLNDITKIQVLSEKGSYTRSMKTQAKALVSAPKKAARGGHSLNPKTTPLKDLQREITGILGITADDSPVTSIDFTRHKETNVSPVERTLCIHHLWLGTI